jgi:hypothetical protein
VDNALPLPRGVVKRARIGFRRADVHHTPSNGKVDPILGDMLLVLLILLLILLAAGGAVTLSSLLWIVVVALVIALVVGSFRGGL